MLVGSVELLDSQSEARLTERLLTARTLLQEMPASPSPLASDLTPSSEGPDETQHYEQRVQGALDETQHPSSELIRLEEVDERIPGVRKVTAEEREATRAARREHLQRRAHR